MKWYWRLAFIMVGLVLIGVVLNFIVAVGLAGETPEEEGIAMPLYVNASALVFIIVCGFVTAMMGFGAIVVGLKIGKPFVAYCPTSGGE